MWPLFTVVVHLIMHHSFVTRSLSLDFILSFLLHYFSWIYISLKLSLVRSLSVSCPLVFTQQDRFPLFFKFMIQDYSSSLLTVHLSTLCLPLPPKQKLKDFFYKLKDNRKLMVVELKMVCAEWHCMYESQNKEVKPVDLITAIKQWIKGLAAQMELNKVWQNVNA